MNYPALTDGASTPHGEDFLLLRATSIPLHPQRRFHRTEPFCNAPCGRGVTEGLLSTGVSSPSPEGTTSALTARGLYIYLFFSIKGFCKGATHPPPHGGGLPPPLTPVKLKLLMLLGCNMALRRHLLLCKYFVIDKQPCLYAAIALLN